MGFNDEVSLFLKCYYFITKVTILLCLNILVCFVQPQTDTVRSAPLDQRGLLN